MKDRISELPDSLLQDILSLLPIKPAIRTSILSKRWRNLWKNLLINATIFDFGEEFAKAQTQEQFVTTVNQYLQLHNRDTIEELRLYFSPGDQYQSDTKKWIKFAILKRVKKLDLDFIQGTMKYILGIHVFNGNKFKLPAFLFSCDSLTNLNLIHCDFSPPSKFTGFASLETLRLGQVSITANALETLLSNCPFLCKLFLRECSELTSIKVSGPKLRLNSLIVVNCLDAYKIEIFAPNLKSFHFRGEPFNGFRGEPFNGHSIENVSSLEDVFISSEGHEFTEPEHDYIPVLSNGSHIKILTVCTATLMHIARSEEFQPEDLPVNLPNLQELQILMGTVINEEYLGYIYGFFKHINCPYLEKLFIEFSTTRYNPSGNNCYIPPAEEPSAFIFSNLLTVKINNFRGSETEMRLVKFILDKAVVLESLVLVSPHKSHLGRGSVNNSGSTSQPKSSETLSSVLHDHLQSMPKASRDAQIVLCEHWEVDTNLFPTHTEYYCEEIP